MPQYTVDALRTIRVIQRSHEIGGRTEQAEQMHKIGDQVEAMGEMLAAMTATLRNNDAELAALKEAVRPVVEWYTRSKRHFPDEFRPRDIALEYDGPFGRVVVLCLELDKLVALVGEG